MKKQILDEFELPNYQTTGNMAKYKSFSMKDDALVFCAFLKEHKVPFKSFEQKYLLDSVIIGSPLEDSFFVEIYQDDFVKVDFLLEEAARVNIEGLDIEDSHLNELDNDELLDIIYNPDEWTPEAELIAQKILLSRNVKLDEASIEAHKKEKKSRTIEPKKGSNLWVFIFFGIGIVGGLTGSLLFLAVAIGMGLSYRNDKTTAPSGKRYYTYDQATRNRGRMIVIVTIVSLAIGLVWMMSMNSNIYDLGFNVLPSY